MLIQSLGNWSISRYRWRSQEWRTWRLTHRLLYNGVFAVLGDGKHVADIPTQVTHLLQVALGEMVSMFPLPGGQFALAGRFTAPEVGFAMGWLYWYK